MNRIASHYTARVNRITTVLLFWGALAAWAQSFPGRYTMKGPNGEATLTVTQGAAGMQGVLTLPGNQQIQLNGRVTNGVYGGTASAAGETEPFTARWNGAQLVLGLGANGAVQLTFTRVDGGAAPSAPVSPAAPVTMGAAEADASDLGFRFTPPAGWTAQRIPAGFAMQSTAKQGMILVLGHMERDINKLKQQAAEGLQDGGSTDLRPVGPPQMLNASTVGVDLAGTIEKQPAKARALAILSPYGGGALVISGAGSAVYSAEHPALADAVARSMRFVKVDASSAVGGWDRRLRGKLLHYFSRYSSGGTGGFSGYSEHNQLNLCADGTYLYRGSFNGAINVPGATATLGGDPNVTVGRWKIVSQASYAALELTAAGGGSSTWTLADDAGKTMLNGKRWLVDDKQPVCR